MYDYTAIEDYQNKLTENQKKLLLKHCNSYGIKPEICAWYDDMEDFYSDWTSVGYSKTDAKSLLSVNDGGEFKKFKNGSIVRLVK